MPNLWLSILLFSLQRQSLIRVLLLVPIELEQAHEMLMDRVPRWISMEEERRDESQYQG